MRCMRFYTAKDAMNAVYSFLHRTNIAVLILHLLVLEYDVVQMRVPNTDTQTHVYRILAYISYRIWRSKACIIAQTMSNCFSLFRLPFCSPFFARLLLCFCLCLPCFFSGLFQCLHIRFAVSVCICYAKRPQSVVFDMCVRGPRSSKLVYKGLAPTAIPCLSPFRPGILGTHKLKMHFKAADGGNENDRGLEIILNERVASLLCQTWAERGGERVLNQRKWAGYCTHTHTHGWTTLKSLFAFS